MPEIDLLIPALIDFARFGNHHLSANNIYHFTQTDANDTVNLGPNHSFLSDQEIVNWFVNLGYNYSLEELFNGDFIDYICVDFDMNEKEYISHILKVLSSTTLKYNANQLNINVYDIKEFWKTMLDFEILFLQRGINDLGYWEWSNFGIHIYNQLATTKDKMILFKEVNKILTAILFPFSGRNNQSISIRINLPNQISEFSSIKIDVTFDTSLQDLLNIIYSSLLVQKVQASSYEKSWILVNRGVVVRKQTNSRKLKLTEVEIQNGSELDLFLL